VRPEIEERLTELAQRYGSQVLARCEALTGNHSTAQDLAQEVFTQLCEVAAHPARQREDLPWNLVAQIMKGVFSEYLRLKPRSARRLVEPDLQVDHRADRAGYRMEQAEQWHAVRLLIEQLDPCQQQVVMGRHLLGMSLMELARTLGSPRTTVRDCYYRAMIRLREMAVDAGILP
jgi:RNA polymerase sigma factor (sigma-70 family)